MILECNCNHSFQDKTYGFRNRVHTHSQKKGQEAWYYCTVCSTKKVVDKVNVAAEVKGKKKSKPQ